MIYKGCTGQQKRLTTARRTNSLQKERRVRAPPRSALGINLPPMFSSPKGINKENEDKRDMTANMLQGIIKMAVQSRLHHHEGVQVNVESNAMGILSGRFGGITVSGQSWRTPLQLTAERIEVALGEMAVNYSALVLEQRISLRNVPSGTCTITLTAADLGNFVVHELLNDPTSTAVEGQAFVFDRDSVRFRIDSHTKEASVYMEGEWAGDNSRYLVKMTPSNGVSRKSLEQHAAAASVRGGLLNRSPGAPPVHKPEGTLRMVAHRVGDSTMSKDCSSSSDESMSVEEVCDGTEKPSATCLASKNETEPTPEEKIAAGAAAILSKSSSNGSGVGTAESSLVSAAALNHRKNGGNTGCSSKAPAPVCNASRIEKGLGSFFMHLSLNLQGIELSKPSLSLLLPSPAEDCSDPDSNSPPQQPLLTITMGLRLLNVPPLDMKF